MAGESGSNGSDVFKSVKAGIERLVRGVRAFARTLHRRTLARERSSSPAPPGIAFSFEDHERVEAAKYSPPALAPQFDAEELPDSYGRSRVTLAVINPYLIYAYWDIDTSRLPADTQSAVLRFYDASESPNGGPFDVDVDLRARNWYVNLWNPAKSYYADLGVRTLQNGFISLAVSNRVHTPRAWPVAEIRVADDEPRDVAAAVGAAVVDQSASVPEPPVAQARAVKTSMQAAGADRVSENATQLTTTGHNLAAAAAESEVPPAPKPVDAAQVLQHKLQEIYSLRSWRSPAGAEASAAAETQSADVTEDLNDITPAREPIGPVAASLLPAAPADLTSLAERQRSPGLPSSLRPTFQRPDSSTR